MYNTIINARAKDQGKVAALHYRGMMEERIYIDSLKF